jgi:hypothetical protein
MLDASAAVHVRICIPIESFKPFGHGNYHASAHALYLCINQVEDAGGLPEVFPSSLGRR